jgi:hypothetical protein
MTSGEHSNNIRWVITTVKRTRSPRPHSESRELHATYTHGERLYDRPGACIIEAQSRQRRSPAVATVDAYVGDGGCGQLEALMWQRSP